MQDSLTVGLLHRLDTLAAKAGIAGGHLWDLWMSTWWRPLIPVIVAGILLVICMPTFFKKVKLINMKVPHNNNPDYMVEQPEEVMIPAIVAMVVCGLITIPAMLVFLLQLPDAITYAFNHQLYAVDQLRQVIGR